MVTTITQYCKDTNKSKQFVSEYIKKGKFKQYETPMYVKVGDAFIEVGKTKVLDVPAEYTIAKISDDDRKYVKQLVTNPLLQGLYLKILQEDNPDNRMKLRKDFDQYLTALPKEAQEAIQAEFNTANEKLLHRAQDSVNQLKSILG